MGSKYRNYQEKKIVKREIHPIWRGIGLIMIFLIPVIAWAAMRTVLDQHLISPLPADLFAQKGQFLFTLFNGDKYINIEIILLLIFAFVLYMIYMFISFIISSAVMGSPEKYDPYYVPPIKNVKRERKQGQRR
jgi:hypothetical protein